MAAASSSLLAQALTTSCSVEIRKGMTFDLTPLRRGEETANGVFVADGSSMYAVNDTAGAGAGREYRYNFNFCGAVQPSQQCEGKGYNTYLPAFQTDIEDDGFCYSLSNQTKYGWQFASYGETGRKSGARERSRCKAANIPPACAGASTAAMSCAPPGM